VTPDEVTAAATVAGVIVTGLFGLTGMIVGLVGLHHARKAKEAAAGANLIAKDAVMQARDANELSESANSIATGANKLSERANEIADETSKVVKAADERAIEHHDVRWVGHWESLGMYAVKNIGIHAAADVVVQIRFSGAIEVAEVAEVKPNETVRLEVPQAKTFYDAKVARSGVRSSPGGIVVVTAGPGSYDVHERIFWRTPLRAPREHAADRKIPLKPKSR